MCLFNILNCPAHNVHELRSILTWPSQPVVAAGLVRCKWHEAVARSNSASKNDSSEFWGPDTVCPYVVMRHDTVPPPEDIIKGIVEAVYLECVPDRGCPKCAATMSAHDMLGRLPSRSEKIKFFCDSPQAEQAAVGNVRDVPRGDGPAEVRGGQMAGGETSGLKGAKRKHVDDKAKKQALRANDGRDNSGSDDDLHVVGERRVKNPRLGRFRDTQKHGSQLESRTVSPFPAASLPSAIPAIARTGSKTPQGRAISSSASSAEASGVSEALLRRKEEVGIAMMAHMSMATQHPHGAAAGRVGNNGGPHESRIKGEEGENDATGRQPQSQPNPQPHQHSIDLTKSSTVESTSSQEDLPARSPVPPPNAKAKAIGEHVSDAFKRLDAAAAARKDGLAHGTGTEEDGEFGVEILRAVRDGSFQSAVEGFSRRQSGLNAPASSSKVGGGRDDRIDALTNTVRILRGEKAAFVDRIGKLLEDKAAAMKTEAALLRRVAELEQIVQANAETP
ncbi:hypothetical protein AYO21_06104 [Fonsecaea monophora]|uniref:Uncharacterized protein n=1 Tax=Fonsecaea monophora TaxID=254056 RepID=A0A177F793_9EURO|nr:hypothetical protein AYO21_06104 [Fonsecaea monophora]OAG39636.1 hypothetical protein AYO21_06104 [Fonsecaea monophora]